MKNYLFSISVALTIIITSCDDNKVANETAVKVANETAKVRKINGIPVFINAEPVNKYEVIGEPVELEGINGILDAINKGGKEAIIEISQDLTFSNKLDKMVIKIKNKHVDLEGILFNNNKLTSGQAIKFK